MELSATTNCCVKGMVSFVCSFVYLFAGSGMIFIPVGIRTIDTKVLQGSLAGGGGKGGGLRQICIHDFSNSDFRVYIWYLLKFCIRRHAHI